ncbi:hypothetical protein FJW06_21360 [Mesorhizobium sp. B4-1-3]|nr:hypothetical protein FJW06_21360 [Mesorhizobium sp. B4-1-3]
MAATPLKGGRPTDKKVAGARVLEMEEECFCHRISPKRSLRSVWLSSALSRPAMKRWIVGRDRVDAAILNLDLTATIDFAATDELLRPRLQPTFAPPTARKSQV